MRFTKYNNPNKKRRVKRKSPYSQQYINERKNELCKLLATTENNEQMSMLIDAFNITIYP